jgi:hypothetical protein
MYCSEMDGFGYETGETDYKRVAVILYCYIVATYLLQIIIYYII